MTSRGGTNGAETYNPCMSVAQEPEEPLIRVYDPEEAVACARPLPSKDVLVIRGVPDDEWTAFQSALAEV